MTDQLLAFSRRHALQPRVLDLNEVVAGMDQQLRQLLGEDIAWLTRLATGLGRVSVDPAQLEQVILNLTESVREAMPEGGRITLETDNVALDEAYCRSRLDVRPGPHVRLAMSSSGQGMDTTKGLDQGTGLGLASVHGIVHESGGHIDVHREPGKGTTFEIYFPQVAETPRGSG